MAAASATQYQVNYDILVTLGNSVAAVNQFKTAIASLNKVANNINNVTRAFRSLTQTLGAFKGTHTLKINIKGSSAKTIRDRAAAIERLNRAIAANKGLPNNLNGGYVRGGGGGRGRSNGARYNGTPFGTPSRNLGYKLLGPTPLPNNGGMAIDMLKGMGIAYGIAGIGQMVSNIVNQASEYDNLMKTVHNILKTHDTKSNFEGRYAGMSQVIRNVGMETKYKVTEVADAAKFLAMAGLDVEGIQNSIRPIADIALVGDTELGQTADLVTNIMTAYNIDPSRMRMMADIMTNTFTMSNTTLTEIAEAYKYSASLLSEGGVSFEEATAAIGTLGDAGIKGSQAGTTMRTIMANIVNPTKKQLAAWDKIGVSRFKSNGELKDIIDIFKDLHNANLGVGDFYRIFHKTAASGAVALASHVDKWDKVMLENFLSGGLSKNLADEKKNTLQGLWAQLTSVFTDKGVDAFNGIQGGLRDIMKNAITWLKDPSTTQTFNNIAKALMELVHTVIEATKTFYWFFQTFGWAIKPWLKFQLYIWPFVKGIAAIKTAFMSLMALKKVTAFLPGLVANTRTLGASMGVYATVTGNAAGAAAGGSGVVAGSLGGGRVLTKGGWAVGTPWLPALYDSQYRSLSHYRNWVGWNKYKNNFSIKSPGSWFKLRETTGNLRLTRPHYSDFAHIPDPFVRDMAMQQASREYVADRKRYSRRVFGRQMLGGFGTMAGMALTGYGASQLMNEENGTAGKVGGGLFAAAGVAAMFGPWGMVAAGVLAAAGAVAKYIDAVNQANKAADDLRKINSDWFVKEGVLIDKNATGIQKWLQTMRQAHHDINEELDLRIQKTRELLGLENNNVAGSMKAEGEMYTTQIEKITKGGNWTTNAPLMAAIEDIQSFASISGLNAARNQSGTYEVSFGGETYKNLGYYDAAGIMAITEEAMKGNFAKQIDEDYAGRVTRAMLANDKNALLKLQSDFENQYGAASWNDLEIRRNWSQSKWKEYAKTDNIAEDGLFQRLIYNRFKKYYGNGNDVVSAMNDFHTSFLANDDKLLERFIRLYNYTGDQGIALTNYGSDNWLESLGWKNNTFVPTGEGVETSLQQAQIVLKQIEDFETKFKQMGLEGTENAGLKQLLEDVGTLKNNALIYQALANNDQEALSKLTIPNGFRYDYMGVPMEYNADNKNWTPAAAQEEVISEMEEAQSPYNYWYDAGAGFRAGLMGQAKVPEGEEEANPIVAAVDSMAQEGYLQMPSLGSYWGAEWGSSYGLNWVNAWNESLNQATQSAINLDEWAGPPYAPDYTKADLARDTGVSLTTNQIAGGGGNKPKTLSGGNGGNGGGHSPKASDYSNHYKSNAAPKQINITIDHLMHVDGIDLLTGDVKGQVQDICRDMAYCLQNVVANAADSINHTA